MSPAVLESVLSSLSLFAPLRPDEIGRIARRFEIVSLSPGERHVFGAPVGARSSASNGASESATLRDGRMVVVVRGEITLTVAEAGGTAESHMSSGDRYGDLGLLTGHSREMTALAQRAATIATLDRTGFDAILEEFPAIALPLSKELASELRVRNDMARQLIELHAEGLPPSQLRAGIESRRRATLRRGARVRRITVSAIFRRLVAERGAEPPFWMLIGFVTSLGLARAVVGLILKYKLEKQLFALVPSAVDPNPMHVHHFNYGLVLIGLTGLAALLPFGRRALRVLAFGFGFGCGLVFDEFALFWNLNPDYRQGASLIAAAIAAVVLVQLTYFRRFWLALVRRWVMAARSRR